MRDPICDVINYCALSFAMEYLSVYLSNRNYNPEKEKIWISNIFYMNSI